MDPITTIPEDAEGPATGAPTGWRWNGSEVSRLRGTFQGLEDRLPHFERRPFAVYVGDGQQSENPQFDMILRAATNDTPEVPVGIVSKKYALLQHGEVLGYVADGLRRHRISPEDLNTDLFLTALGERMELAILFPPAFHFDPGDGHPIGLQIRCFNSVEGSTRLMLVVGWLRFVCLNGMIIGKTAAQVQQIHNASLAASEISRAIDEGLALATKHRSQISELTSREIEEAPLRRWVNTTLQKAWRVKAAARAYHIIQAGRDAKLVQPFESVPPTERRVVLGPSVPGAAPMRGSRTSAYAVTQALSWLAGQRRDVQEAIEWQLQTEALMTSLYAA